MNPATTSSISKVQVGVFSALTYSHTWIALCAAAQVSATAALFGPTADELAAVHRYAALVFVAGLSFYSFHRLYSLWGLLPTLPSVRWKLVYRLQRLLMALVPLGFAATAVLWFCLPPAWQWRILLPGLVSALYALPVFQKRRLRDVGGSKVLLLSLGWVWLCNGVPLGSLAHWDGLFLVERFAFLVALTLPFDYRDQEQDAAQQVITWPQRLGRSWCFGLSCVLLLLSMAYWVTIYQAGQASAAALGFGGSSMLTLLLLPTAFAKTRPHHLYYSFVLDGTLVTPLLALWWF